MKKISTFFRISNLIAIFFVLIIGSTAFGQVSIGFSVDPSPCQPFTVHFTGTCPGAVYYQWYFNDDSTSTLQNPDHIYKHGGRYWVSLVAFDGGMGYLGQDYVELDLGGGPNRIYAFPDTVCPGDQIYYYMEDDYNINNIVWYFGDLTDWDYDQRPNHVYDNVGEYTVSVRFEVDGCPEDTLYKNMVVRNDALPAPDFWINSPVCPNQNVDFGTGNTYNSYNWKFGDGDSSDVPRPIHQYGITGKFGVTLDVSNNCGMSSRTDTIEVRNDVEWGDNWFSFNISETNICPGQEVQMGYWPQGVSTLWDLGDGFTSTDDYVGYMYPDTGTYPITLTATNGCGLDTVLRDTIRVYYGIADWSGAWFGSSQDTACPGDEIMFFANNGFNSYEWNFNDEDNSDDWEQTNYAFSTEGEKVIYLTISNDCDQDTTITDTVYISSSAPASIMPDSWGTPAENGACAGDSVIFYAFGGSSYEFDFGDGQSETETFPFLVDDMYLDVVYHQYAANGEYDVVLTLYNGCGNTATDTMVAAITDTVIPEVMYMYDEYAQHIVCEPIEFTALGGTSYEWVFEPGDTIVTTDMITTHSFPTPGMHNVTLISFNKCGNSNSETFTVIIDDILIGTPSYEGSCPGDSTLFMASGGSDYVWDFGDGETGSSDIFFYEQGMELNIIYHAYAVIGTYNVSVTYENYCGVMVTDSFEYEVGNSAPVNGGLGIVSDPWSIQECSVVDFIAVGGASYKYYFGDGDSLITTSNSASHMYSDAGEYIIELEITNGCGNSDISTEFITINEPDIGATVDNACANDSVIFYASTGSNFNWDFGDGNSTTIMEPLVVFEDTTYITKHAYLANGTYEVILNYTTDCGEAVADTFSIDIGGSQPVTGELNILANFENPACAPIDLIALGGSTYDWDFGDGTTQSTSTGFIQYAWTNGGLYEVEVTITNGCSNTATYSEYVNIDEMTLGSLPTDLSCDNSGDGAINISVNGGVEPYLYAWSNLSTNQNAINLDAGPHSVTVTDDNGCEISQMFVLDQPDPVLVSNTLTTDPSVCAAADGSIDITVIGGTPGYTFDWSSGDVTEDVIGTLPAGVHSVLITDTQGCENNYVIELNDPTPPVVTLDPIANVCPHDGIFTLTGGTPAMGVYKINGVTATQFNPWAEGSGTHTISYTFTDGFSCSATATQTLQVDDQPLITFIPFADICENVAGITLTGGNPIGGEYQISGIVETLFNPMDYTDGDYDISYIYDDGTCIDTAIQTITVLQKPMAGLSTFAARCVDADVVPLTGGTPVGGDYEINWAPETDIDPPVLGDGTFTIAYIYSDGTCSDTVTEDIVIYDLPAVSIGVFGDMCLNEADITITGGTPAGGSYEINGNPEAFINPAGLGVGVHDIDYIYTNVATSCTNTASETVEILGLPVVNLAALANTCENVGPITLTGGTPGGGIYQEGGVTITEFDPMANGDGMYDILYIYDDGSCIDTAIQTLTILQKPMAGLNPFPPMCISETAIPISGGTPIGGSYEIDWSVETDIDPMALGGGTHPIAYIYSDGNCSDTIIEDIIINDLPVVALAPIADICVNVAPIPYTGGTPLGGTYQIGINVGSQIDPDALGVGSFTALYIFEDANGCRDTADQSFDVLDIPVASHIVTEAGCGSADGAIDLTVTGGQPLYNIDWSDGTLNTEDLSAIAAGIYTAVITDANGCIITEVAQVDNVTAPSVTLAAFAPLCDNDDVLTLTGGLPAGGTYTVESVTATDFNPSIGGGTYTITYSVDSSGCIGSASENIVVNTAPLSTLSALFDMCTSESPLTLTEGIPVGGTYIVDGVLETQIDPAAFGAGPINVEYVYTDANSCTDTSDTETITIIASPTVTLAALADMCDTEATLTLTGGLPASGTYFINGSASAALNPSTIGAGTHTIKYTYSDGTCSDSANVNITIGAMPTVALSAFADVCAGGGILTLSGGTPVTNGTYKVDDIVATTIDPTTADTVSIKYIYDDNICADSATQELIILESAGTAALTAFADMCSGDTAITLTGGTPAGGIYEVDGTAATNFNPASGSGSYTVNYIVVQGSCSDTASQQINVISTPNAALTAFADMCTIDASITLSGGTPAGGMYFVNSVPAANFDPAASGAGVYAVTYLMINAGICSDTATELITVSVCGSITDNANVNISLYPNPSSGIINILNSNGSPLKFIQVINIQGKTLMEHRGEDIKKIDLSEFNKGVYFLLLTYDSITYSRKIEIVK